MRPLFAIAPLALAFVLLAPTEVSSTSAPALVARAWHVVFDRDAGATPARPAAKVSATPTAER